MRALAMLKGSRTAVLALAGCGLALGLVFAAGQAGGEARDTATLCSRLNVGDGACDHAYLTKDGFDRAFADVAAASSLTEPARGSMAEQLRLAGAKRLGPTTPVEQSTVTRTRLAEADPVRTLIDVDPALHTTPLDEAAIFRLLLTDPTGSSTDRQMSSISPDRASNGG